MAARLFSPSPCSLCCQQLPLSLFPTSSPSSLCLPRPLTYNQPSSLRRRSPPSSTSSHAAPVGLPFIDPPSQQTDKWGPEEYEAVLKGGEQVTSVLQEMVTLLDDMELDAASEAAAVEIAAQGVIGRRVDEMESGFMMSLDYMIQTAEKDGDDQVTDELLD